MSDSLMLPGGERGLHCRSCVGTRQAWEETHPHPRAQKGSTSSISATVAPCTCPVLPLTSEHLKICLLLISKK